MDVKKMSEPPLDNPEGRRMLFELFRHVATVSSAAILVTMSIVEKFVHNPNYRWLLVAVFVLFGLSIVASTPAMMILTIIRPRNTTNRERQIFVSTAVVALSGMFGGFFMLAEFLWYNL